MSLVETRWFISFVWAIHIQDSDETIKSEPCKLAFTGKNDGIPAYADRSSFTTALLHKKATSWNEEGKKRERERETRESTVKEPTATKTEGNKDEGSEPPRSACCIGREVHRSLEIIIIAADNECCRRQFDIRRR